MKKTNFEVVDNKDNQRFAKGNTSIKFLRVLINLAWIAIAVNVRITPNEIVIEKRILFI